VNREVGRGLRCERERESKRGEGDLGRGREDQTEERDRG